MEAQVPHSSWGLDPLLLLSCRLFAEKKLLQKDGLKPINTHQNKGNGPLQNSSEHITLHVFKCLEK